MTIRDPNDNRPVCLTAVRCSIQMEKRKNDKRVRVILDARTTMRKTVAYTNSRGNSRGQLSSAPTPLRANSEVAIPRDGICILATKLHVLLVLPPDFDKPKKISEDKVYNVQVQFKQLTPKMREVYNCNFLGFLETAYWSKGRLQMHAMVMLLYLIVKGDSIRKGHYESDMTAKIIFFAQFENMLGSPDSFQDINIMLGNIGKMRYEEMSKVDIFKLWYSLQELEKDKAIWPSVAEIHWADEKTYLSNSQHVCSFQLGMQLPAPPLTKWYYQEHSSLILTAGELKTLIKLEKHRQMGPLAIEMLTWVDVGLFRDSQGQLCYWVNEVMHPPWCAQMLHMDNNNGELERTAVSVKESLVTAHLNHRNMYP
ncbi:hypothetical protein L208DRAFT_1376829 [Tricholoma matsutake]|nr:hypothetical protein L208DRAFT_1376829 [Tricholoma matsutake 945]